MRASFRPEDIMAVGCNAKVRDAMTASFRPARDMVRDLCNCMVECLLELLKMTRRLVTVHCGLTLDGSFLRVLCQRDDMMT